MATRRPAPSRARVNNSSLQQPRSRSVMSKSASTTDDLRDATTPVTTSWHQKSTSSQDDMETNIQVVIRCRRRSEREVQDNSPSIVSSTGAKSKEVSIEVSTPMSSLGIITLPPLRTYPFDLVFGPEADQAMVYHEVVSPMLDEVLKGYNCTLFAYGQTGTGKTYTMQGDLNPTPMGNPSAHAGMIPRVLFRLFHHLEQSKMDYSVKISYIELYNEELRDLLAHELSAPTGAIQPMGMAGKDSSKNMDNNLKIFDDSNKRGVMIQGLEEIAVKDSQAALALLTKGSLRRQIAATKFNDHSSRSHSVFSITVHIKEPSAMGEDLLKIGKLNLVDLAGSENIGRSGAENKRAREAGMINQSLLTLGRVINALVDKASHIPYRESKLTRLLQDSLGGCTKTCIIATISPARSNVEETLSTLDYALRAKSIRNKPELNQRTTRNSLLKEYISEIERLKSDLLAAREKNGIFFSEETWNQMTAEQELRITELGEAKKQVEIVERQMRGIREEFEQSIGLLKIKEGELSETRKKLRNVEEVLGRKEGELNVVKGALKEEVIVRNAHQNTELALDRVASELKKVAEHSLRDLKGLFEKLERKAAILNSNNCTVLTTGSTVSTASHALAQRLDEYISSSSQSILRLHTEATEFQTKELDALSSFSARVDEQSQQIQNALNHIRAKDALEADALDVVHNIIKGTHDTFQAGFDAWGQVLKETSGSMSMEIQSACSEALVAVEVALKTMISLAESVIQETNDHIDAEHQALSQAKVLANETSKSEIMRLRRQNEILSNMLETERIKASKAKDELIHQMSSLLGKFIVERDRGLKDVVGSIKAGNNKSEEGMKTFLEKHEELMTQMENSNGKTNELLQKRASEGKRTRDGVSKILASTKSTMNDQLNSLQSAVSSSITSYSTQLEEQTESLKSSCADAFERHTRAKRARIDITTSMSTNIHSEYRHMQKSIVSTSRNVEAIGGRIISETSKLGDITEAYCNTASTHLGVLQTASEVLSEKGVLEDESTGLTPRKRVWEYADKWDLTQSRDIILRTWREQGTPDVSSNGHIAGHHALPDNGGLDEETEMLELVGEQENIPLTTVHPLGTASFSPMESIPALAVSKGMSGHKKGIPSLGALTDTKNVYMTRNSRRAR